MADAGRYVHEGFTGLSSRRLNFCTCSYVMRRGLADKAPLQAVAYAGKAQVQGLRSADTHTRTAGIGACRFIRRRLFFKLRKPIGMAFNRMFVCEAHTSSFPHTAAVRILQLRIDEKFYVCLSVPFQTDNKISLRKRKSARVSVACILYLRDWVPES